MRIDKHKVVTIDFTLKDDQGNLIDQSADGSFAYLHGAQNLIPGLESALDGRGEGDNVNVTVPPEQGYGERDETRLAQVPREMFPDDAELTPGAQFEAQGPEGERLLVTVRKVEDEQVTVDGNHPLAGENLNFDVKVVGVRDATEEEISHGHVHGPHGHDHG